MQAIILCGGKGTRIASLLPKGIPKAMADIRGRPFLWYLLKYWEPYIDRFVLATGFGRSHIQSYFKDGIGKSEIRYIEQKRGTAAAVRTSLIHISEDDFFVINGDTYFELDPIKMMNHHKSNDQAMTLGYSTRANMHAGIDILTKTYPWRATIFPSTSYFIDIGTPEGLTGFREYVRENFTA